MAHYFPEEIICEILLRLPVKSLVRFTCVNKAWRCKITSPTFASAHLAHTNCSHNNSTRLFALNVSRDHQNYSSKNITTILTACHGKQATEQDRYNKSFDEFTELSFSYKRLMHFKVVGSCNGLVLLKCYIETLILWNPLLGKFLTLPEPHDFDQYENCHLRSTNWGFGFDSRTNDYKVVRIVCLKNNLGLIYVQVFSLSTGYWKSIRVVGAPACRLSNRGPPQPFINGAVHWAGSRHFILSIDISNEIFREIMLPERLTNLNYPIIYSIWEYGKSLALCVGATLFHSSLWVMREYGAAESWTQVLNFNGLDIPKPLGFTRSGEVLWKTESGELASFDPKSPKTYKYLYHSPETESCEGGYCFAGSYVESLVLLNESSGARRGMAERKRAREQQSKTEWLTACLEHLETKVSKKRKRREE